MGEADRVAVVLDDVSSQCGTKDVGRHARAPKERLARRAQRSGEREGVARPARETRDAIADELVERRRNRQRLERVDSRTKAPRDFERIERIAPGLFVHPNQGLPRERPAESVADETVDSPDAHRADGQLLDGIRSKGALEGCELRAFPATAREDKARRDHLEAVQCERKCGGRRGINPLDVVNRDDKRLLRGEKFDRAANSGSDRALIDDRARLVLQKQRDLEGSPTRRSETRKHLLEHPLEEIGEASVGQAMISLRRTRRQDEVAERLGLLDSCGPQGRLADPGVSLEHERRGSGPRLHEESFERSELFFPADDRDRHAPRDDRDGSRRARQGEARVSVRPCGSGGAGAR